MKKILLFIFLLITATYAQSEKDPNGSRPKYISGQLIIKYKSFGNDPRGSHIYEEYDSVMSKLNKKIHGIAIKQYNPVFNDVVRKMVVQNATEREVTSKERMNRLNKRLNTYLKRDNDFSKVLRIKYDTKTQKAYEVRDEILLKAHQLEQEGFKIVYVEPVYLRYNNSSGDPLYSQQWSHTVTNIEQVWGMTEGDSEVVISIIDTGVDPVHPDLKDNLLNNGYDFVDIDTANYIQDGYVLIQKEDYTQEDSDYSDYHGHGTHCAGIAAAKGNNGIGVKGVAPSCKLLAIRAGFSILDPNSNEEGLLEVTAVAKSIKYAVDNNTDIISMSFGGELPSALEKEAIDYAYNNNIVLISASGNISNANGNSSHKSYPAGYDEVLSVTSIDENLRKSDFSDYGYWTDIAAPGSNIISTVPIVGGLCSDSSGYKILSGTSMATPYIAGVAALYLSQNKNKNNSEVYQALRVGVNSYLFTDCYIGTGIVNAYKVLQENEPCIASITSPIAGDSIILLKNSEFSISGKASGKSFSTYFFEISTSINDPSSWKMIGNYYMVPVDSGFLGKIQIPLDGVYYLRLNVKNSADINYTDLIGPITGDKRLKEHWPVNTNYEIVSSPVISDIDKDGNNEIIINSSSGSVYVLDKDGNNKPGWPVRLDSNAYKTGMLNPVSQVVGYCSPAVGDLDNDGKEEIVVRDGEYLYVFDYLGRLSQGWPRQLDRPSIGNNQVGSPVIADIDLDGFKDILINQLDGLISVFKKNGYYVQGWPQKTLNWVHANLFSTPVVSDINEDGKPEIVIQSVYTNDTLQQGSLYVYDNGGELLPGWPQIIDNGGFVSPIAADINNDSLDEIIACSHINVKGSIYGKLGVYVFNKDGKLLDGWPAELAYNQYGYYDVTTGLSAGDINNDGLPEIVVTSSGYDYSLWTLDGKGKILWHFNSMAFEYVSNSVPLIADINSDNKPEIIFSKLQNFPEQRGRIIVVDNEGQINEALSRTIPEQIRGTPSIGDVDNDNKLELISGAQKGNIYCWGFDAPCDSQKMIWPTYQGNKYRTGKYSYSAKPNAVSSAHLSEVPVEYYISNIYPNPFNPSAKFEYSLPEPSQLIIIVYNILGQKVDLLVNQKMNCGNYTFEWNGSRYASGVYFLKFIAKGIKSKTKIELNKKFLLLK